MGCFDETCAISRIAIHWEDPVYVVVWEPHRSFMGEELLAPERSTYELAQAMARRWEYVNDVLVTTGEYVNPEHEHVKILHGHYDDYGWIVTRDKNSRETSVPRPECTDPSGPDGEHNYSYRGTYFFVHTEIARHACEVKGINLDGGGLGVVAAIAELAYLTRTPLFVYDWLLGEQYGGRAEWEKQHALAIKTSEILTRKIGEWKEETGE